MRQRTIGASEATFHARLRTAVEWPQRHVRPAHGVTAVAVVAAVALAGSQLLDYRGVRIGASAYAEVEGLAPAPDIERQRASAAHGWAVYPIALAGLVAALVAAGGRWRVARLLVPLGLAAVAISLAIDAPSGLDDERAALAYEGAEAVLLEGFWAQLFAGAVLASCGPLLAGQARAGHRARRRARRRPERDVMPASGAFLALCAVNAPGEGVRR